MPDKNACEIKTHKIGILGVGAIGSVIAFELLKNPKNLLFFYNRSKKTTIKLMENGVLYEIPISLETSLQEEITLDWLFICLKEHQYKKALHWLTSLIKSNTKVVVIRNGLDLKKSIEPFTSLSNSIACMIDCPVQPLENGFYKVFGKPKLMIPNDDRSDGFIKLFRESISIIKTQDFKTASWVKLCESASLGAILFLSGKTCVVLKEEQWLALLTQILEECIQVARADGAKLPINFKNMILLKVLSYPPEKGSSMLTDLRLGNKIEIGAKNGIITKKAKDFNIATPENDLVVKRLLKWNSEVVHKASR